MTDRKSLVFRVDSLGIWRLPAYRSRWTILRPRIRRAVMVPLLANLLENFFVGRTDFHAEGTKSEFQVNQARSYGYFNGYFERVTGDIIGTKLYVPQCIINNFLWTFRDTLSLGLASGNKF